jgi:hypothetical protein
MQRPRSVNDRLFQHLIVLFALLYVAIRSPAFVGLTDLLSSSFEPVGILWFLGAPIPTPVWFCALGLVGVSGIVALSGRATRTAMILFASSVLVVTTYRSSWGQLLWFENLLVIHLVVLTMAIALRSSNERLPDWAMQGCAIATVVLYVLAGIAKLRYGGIEWISGDVLANHIGYSSARLSVFGERPPLLASFAMNHRGALAVASFLTVALELAAPLALWRRCVAVIWSLVTWGMHLGTALTMAVVFPYPLTGLAFVPVVATAARSSRRRTASDSPRR